MMSLPLPLPGLLPASFRGVSFFVPNVKSTVGRRVAAHYFPGLDVAAYDDMGLHAQRISFDPLYIGDDYIAHGRRLKAAFEQPGPGTLVHPWFGAVNVILIEPAEISFSSTELRMVRFSVEFERVTVASKQQQATSPALGAAGQVMASAAQALIQAVQVRTLYGCGRMRRHVLVGVILICGVVAVRSFLPEVMPSTPMGLAKAVNGLSGRLVDLTAEVQSTVALATGVIPKPLPLSPDQGLELVLDKAQAMVVGIADALSITDATLSAAVTGDLLSCVAPLLERVQPRSRRQALSIRAKATEVLNGFSNDLQSLFETVFAGEASSLNRAVREMGLRLIADINETIGRLPQTTILKLEQVRDAWGIAHMLYGDDLSQVEAGYLDLIARNRLRHPARIEASNIEILLASSDSLHSLSRTSRDRLLIEAGSLEILP